MTYEAREFARVSKVVGIISLTAWIILLDPGGSVHAVHHHTANASMAHRATHSSLELMILPGARVMLSWVVMLVAMMAPMLIAPICHLRLRSLKRRRARAVALFVAAYAGIWLLCGWGFLAIGAWTTNYAGQSYLPAAVLLVIALAWQFSPAKQQCLNGCHSYRKLAAFGSAADIDAFRYGAAHAGPCVGSCWAWMLLPMVLPHGHLLAMVAVTVLLFCERLEDPQIPAWQIRRFGRAARILKAQFQIPRHWHETSSAENRLLKVGWDQ